MKRLLFYLMATVTAWSSAVAEEAVAPAPSAEHQPRIDHGWINNFNVSDNLETDWKFDGGRFLTPKTRFFLSNEASAVDGKVMVVEANRSSGVLLSAPAPVDLEKTPIMRWRWRLVRPVVLTGPEEPDDQAVVIYFGDGTLLKQRCVGYRWEVKRNRGEGGTRKYAAGMMTVRHICARNSSDPVGEWVVEERDVVADYIAAFGARPKDYFIVSVGANSQYSKSNTRAEIDYIEFVPRPEAAAAPTAEEQK